MYTHFKRALPKHLIPCSLQAIEDYLIGEFSSGICVI